MASKNKRKLRKIKLEGFELDITSLLDILVILLVFLLKSYSSSIFEVKLDQNLSVAPSKSEDEAVFTSTIQINRHGKIILNKTVIGNINEGNRAIAKLQNALKDVKDTKKKTINLIIDQDLEYGKINKILVASSSNKHQHLNILVKKRH